MAKRLLRIDETLRITGATSRSWYRLVRQGEAPRPVRIGKRAVAWPLAELEAWIDQRIAERDAAGKEATPAEAS